MTTSTVLSTGRLRVASGFMATRATTRLAVGHAALDAAAPVGLPPVGAGPVVPDDGVVGLGAPPSGHVEAVADLDPLDRLDAHQGLGQQAVEPAVPVHVAAEPDRDAVADDLDHPAEGVADLGRRLDLGDHGRLGLGVEAAHLRLVDARQVGEGRAGRSTW